MNKNRYEKLSIAVVGHLVDDEIIRPGGAKISALGGISYNLAALLSIMKKAIIFPVCEIGQDIQAKFNKEFGENEIVDSSGVKILSRPNVVNRLVYDHSGNREEWNSRIPDRLSLVSLSDDIDALLLNFISGDDVGIEELSRFKERSNALIYCDYHSLALGRDDQGKRFYRKHPEWEQYLAQVDIAQMNSKELATITGNESDRAAEIAAGCMMIHRAGPKTVVVTMGRKGAVISLDNGRLKYFLPPIPISQEIDPTGCGDTFASVFLYNYLLTQDPLKSAKIAAGFAAAKATFSGIDGFNRIDDTVRDLKPGSEPIEIL